MAALAAFGVPGTCGRDLVIGNGILGVGVLGRRGGGGREGVQGWHASIKRHIQTPRVGCSGKTSLALYIPSSPQAGKLLCQVIVLHGMLSACDACHVLPVSTSKHLPVGVQPSLRSYT